MATAVSIPLGVMIGLFVQWIVGRRIWRSAKAAGFLEGRDFLTSRAKLSNLEVWVDGVPIDAARCVWIETNAFTSREQAAIEADKLERQADGQMLGIYRQPAPEPALKLFR